ncbi:unnamed protein product [Cunninghamella blakesleeana]
MNPFHAFLCIVLLVSLLVLYYINNLSAPTKETLYSPPFIAYEQQQYDNNISINNNSNINPFVNHPTWLCDCFYPTSPEPLLIRDSPIISSLPPVIDGQEIPLIELNQSIPSLDEAVMTILNNNLQYPKTLLLTIANYGVRHHVYNWIHSLEKTNEHCFVIVCLDIYLYKHLVKAGYKEHTIIIPKHWQYYATEGIDRKGNGMDKKEEIIDHQSQDFRLITFTKTTVIQHILNLDFSAFYSDVDVIWNRPRTREFVRTLMDIRGGNTHALFLQQDFQQQEISTAFFLMRPTPVMQRFISDAIYIQQQHEIDYQQSIITTSLNNESSSSTTTTTTMDNNNNNQRMTHQLALNKALSNLNLETRSSHIVLLEVFHFSPLDDSFQQLLRDKLFINPYIIHANSLVGKEKIEKLKENGLWYIEESKIESIDQEISK